MLGMVNINQEFILDVLSIFLTVIGAVIISVYAVNQFEKSKTVQQRKIDFTSEVSEYYQNLRVQGVRVWDTTVDLSQITDQPYSVNQVGNWAKIKAFGLLYYKPNGSRSRINKFMKPKFKDDRYKDWTDVLQQFISARNFINSKLAENLKISNNNHNELDKQEIAVIELIKQTVNSTYSDLHQIQPNVLTQIIKNLESKQVERVFDIDISNLTHKEILELLDEYDRNNGFKLFSDTLDNALDKTIEYIQQTEINL